MKFLSILFISIILLTACTPEPNQIILVKNNHSEYSIVVSTGADSLTHLAANELQHYIFEVSQTRLEIKTKVSQEKKHILIGRDFIMDPSSLVALDTLDEDGFMIRVAEDIILISGNDGKSNLYAAYTFIEEFLGCRLLTPSEEFIPETATLVIPETEKIYKPDFAFRRILFPAVKSEKYRHWHKLETLDEWGMFVHTFDDLISPEKYFGNHPEFFSLVGNHRLKDAQLCLSNPEVIRTLKENLGAEIAKKPGKKYWSVSQNDCYNYCECDECEVMYAEYGSVSGAYLYMANELAKAFPDKQISTLAYQFTRSAPKNITPLDNVNIMFCSIECNRSMPLEDDSRSTGFVKDMKDWSLLTDNILVWDYVVQFKNYLTPFPNFHVLQPNIRFFYDNNVSMMFQQGSGGNWSDLSDMKQYLISKLLWDKDADKETIVNDFIQKYYGPAASFIQSYYELTHNVLKDHQENEFLNIYGFPSDYADSYLTPDLLIQYKELMDKAEESVQQDSIYLKRVLKTRLPVDFAYLDITLNKNQGDLTYFQEEGDSIYIRQEMLDYLERFVQIADLTGATRINERNFTTEAYKVYVLRKLRRMTRANLAKDKTIKVTTPYSDRYPVGGEKALTDGLLGDLDFHNNWLGFHGEDMIVEIDLHKKETVSQVCMNFLKAVNSWVFLPVEVIVEVSADGENYIKAGSLKGDVTNKNYLVKSIPFDIHFNPVEIQFLRIKANSLKQCPVWHRGYGNPSWIFIDEVIVE